MTYLTSIKTACLLFPPVALLFTLPFIIHQYHKYGSINKLRCLIIYSFILYLMVIYFLVILPLPNPNTLTYRDGMVKLIPGGFIFDILDEASITITNPRTFLNIFKSPGLYTTLLNILMTIPFGMYLRYYYKCNLKRTCLYSLLLSLFFEATQLTHLYFIYKYQYRVFDVDDLIMNTLGGVIGYFLVPTLTRFLPSRDLIDEQSFQAGKTITGLRRILHFILDIVLFNFIILFFRNIYVKIIIFILYYSIYPYFNNNQTLFGKLLNVRYDVPNLSLIRLPLRYLIIYYYYFKLPFKIIISIPNIIVVTFNHNLQILLVLVTLILILAFYFINTIFVLKNKKTFYDKLLNVEIKSTIGFAKK